MTGLAANFSPMPRIAPPPLGRQIAGGESRNAVSVLSSSSPAVGRWPHAREPAVHCRYGAAAPVPRQTRLRRGAAPALRRNLNGVGNRAPTIRSSAARSDFVELQPSGRHRRFPRWAPGRTSDRGGEAGPLDAAVPLGSWSLSSMLCSASSRYSERRASALAIVSLIAEQITLSKKNRKNRPIAVSSAGWPVRFRHECPRKRYPCCPRDATDAPERQRASGRVCDAFRGETDERLPPVGSPQRASVLTVGLLSRSVADLGRSRRCGAAAATDRSLTPGAARRACGAA